MKFRFTQTFLASALFFTVSQTALAQSAQDSNASKGGESTLDYGYGPADAPIVTVGSQVWLGKNLNVDHFANGDAIPQAVTEDEWKLAGENRLPAWCFYKLDPANGPLYGRLYNWYAVNDPRGLAPSGWHVPTDGEWDIIIKHLAGDGIEVNKPVRSGYNTYYFTKDVGTSLKSTSGWKKNTGTNKSGFGALPGGNRLANGPFDYLGKYGSWWSSSEDGTDNAWYRGLYFGDGKLNRFAYLKNCGFSVRCVKD